MKIVIPGGTGQVGGVLTRAFKAAGHEVVIIGRSTGVRWDGHTLGRWADEIDGADVVINLAGRSVSCRYTAENLQQMMRSRVDSAPVVGEAIAKAANPPGVWLQMSTATIYAHRFDAANDEETGVLGGREPDVPGYWTYSVEIAKRWEAELDEADTPATRKVALRAAMVMSPDRGGVFDYLSWLARLGLGGPVAGGHQYVSWIHDDDFVRAVALLIREPIAGAVNLAAPNPVPQREFMRELRQAWHVPVGLPATSWMAEIGAFAIRSDTELLLKSRRVVPGRLLQAGFEFHFPNWREAAQNLAESRR
ncbi:TIGR01777 family oxidoreductase [Lentzea sp. BCCO 10_0798]|uniref:TIGR01777 family oxidoreductase n=1 Tax=Lentzea kristufekii TaxID=3095430 RepID=A0ABU4TKA9_9PSEU|nr:TIGR01777 family oxidoreductase [Lentzea sp. BCCO 10_0798]MDX8048714.1 TIGR01777 family oxidoreductase [Lentzea sp. BCCO 10_0798]